MLKEPSLQQLKAAAVRQAALAADVAAVLVLAEMGRVPAVAVRVVALASAKVLRIPSVLRRAELAVRAEDPAPEGAVRTPRRSVARPFGLAARAMSRLRPTSRSQQHATRWTPIPTAGAGCCERKPRRGGLLPQGWGRPARHRATVADHPILERYNVSPQIIIAPPAVIWKEALAFRPCAKSGSIAR
jgi:hypothetical protein